MYKIILSKSLYDYMTDKLEDNLKNKIKDISYKNDKVDFYLDVDTKLDIMEFVEDKQLEIGFVNEDYLNDDGEKLQKIYDEIYYQTN
ncbi:hypothetical protein FDC50_10120 [Clostridium botulinum]|uniref:hypothetical protein n=1 Tax=Clostridium botulinum TaxID=1491 RepID=UPI0005072AAD|nr:hypothetical protein [Clostridium botulinum]KFX56155.1 hypothetical protein KU41_17510 [Clostridium botulinum]KIL06920.1 hypothetical protein SR42_15250 [Clostridium botulinum]MBN1059349.1 hypothetical protein [Clostridium botulinum]MBN1079304.1 hypothetical protein [Clostridium botulinum]MBY6804361.1 hypothetical protein [Clostridium botulinum]